MAAIDLEPRLLLAAYSKGYFPMPDPEDERRIAWYNPDPRAIMPLEGFHCSRSLRRLMQKGLFRITVNRAFSEVMAGCADRKETWITDDMSQAYLRLHRIGAAHSLEVWQDDALVGGVYGVSIGAAFFAESKFHRVANASKVALASLVDHLKRQRFELLEVQFLTPHLASLGAITIPSSLYLKILESAIRRNVVFI